MFNELQDFLKLLWVHLFFFFSNKLMLFCLSLRVWSWLHHVRILYLGTLLNARLEGIANSAFDCTSFSFLYKLIIHTFMYKCTRASTAALSLRVSQKSLSGRNWLKKKNKYRCFSEWRYLVEEQSEMSELNGLIHISIFTYNERWLASKLKGHCLKVAFWSQLKNNLSHISRTGESNL